jgi:hypothetical protein
VITLVASVKSLAASASSVIGQSKIGNAVINSDLRAWDPIARRIADEVCYGTNEKY